MKRVLIESPYAGDLDANVSYAQLCMLDCLKRGEAPFASHLLYTQMLRDDDPYQRALGIEAGLCWGIAAHMTAVYLDRGVSNGMRCGIERAVAEARDLQPRSLYHPDLHCYEGLELKQALADYYDTISHARALEEGAPTSAMSVLSHVLSALKDRGSADVKILRDGFEAEVMVNGAALFLYVDKTGIGLRRASSFDWVRLEPKTPASKVADAALKIASTR